MGLGLGLGLALTLSANPNPNPNPTTTSSPSTNASPQPGTDATAEAGDTRRQARLAVTTPEVAATRAVLRVAASRLTMKGATEPGSGMCRKLSEKEG